MKQTGRNQRKAERSEMVTTPLHAIVERWLRAEVRALPEAESHAGVAMRRLPRPMPPRNLVAAVMAALAPPSLWSRAPVRYLVTATVLILGIGVVAVVGSGPALASIAGLALWRDLAAHLLVVAIDFGVGLWAAVSTTIEVVAASPQATVLQANALWFGALLFLSGTIAMTWISIWRDKEIWKHV